MYNLTYKQLQREKRRKEAKKNIYNALLISFLLFLSIGVSLLRTTKSDRQDYALVACSSYEFDVGDIVYLGNGELVKCNKLF